MSSSYRKDIIRYTSCGFHCFDQCILKVRIRDGRIVYVEPDDTINPGVAREGEHPGSGFLTPSQHQFRPCPKGYSMARAIYDPRRLIYPMKCVGRRGDGKFKRISWDEALDTIVGKLVETKEKYGPYSIIHEPYSFLSRCSFPLAPWFGAGIAGWDAHSTGGWQEPQNWVYGKDLMTDYPKYGHFVFGQDETNLFKSRLIVLWGFNPLVTESSGVNYNLIQARERGIPIVCIESRYTTTVEVLADQWIPVRPTTDAAMMIAMANVWFREGLCDKDFIDKWVDPQGVEKWKAYVLGTSDGIDKTPGWAEEICGVPAETIAGFARLYADSKPVNLNVGLAMGRQFFGENGTRASMYLQALTGNTMIPGGNAVAEGGLHWGRIGGPLPKVDWRQKPGSYKSPVLISAYKWPKAVNLRETLDKGEITRENYNRMIGNLPDNPTPNIKMVILDSNNHVQTLPGMNQSILAMKKVDFSLVFSQYTDMASAFYADMVLPQIYTAFEGRNGGCGTLWPLFTTTMCNLGSQFVYRQKCVDPPGEVRPNDWVWTQVAKRLGLAEMFNPRLAHVPYDGWDECVEEIYKEAYENWASRAEIVPLGPPTWEEFRKRPVFRFPMEGEPYHSCKHDLDAGLNPFRGTASDKIEFHSDMLAKGSQYLENNDVPHGSGKCYGGGNLPPMAQMVKGGRDTFFSKDAEKYPLLMSSPHSYYRMHSWLDNNPWLNDCYRHAAWMNAADAKSRGVKDNDLVRVFNDRGEMVLPAYVTSRIVPGTVVVHHGGWYVPGREKSDLMPDGIDMRGAPNMLTHDVDLPETVIGCYPCKGLVEIEKWRGK